MHFINDVHLVSALRRRVLHLVPNLADIIHTVVGGRINLDDIHRCLTLNCPAHGTLAAGTPVHRMLTVHRPGKYLRHRCLSRSPGTAEQIGMSDAPETYLIF